MGTYVSLALRVFCLRCSAAHKTIIMQSMALRQIWDAAMPAAQNAAA